MMNLQLLVTILIIATAAVFAGLAVMRRARSFSVKKKCDVDCGCGTDTRK